MVYSRTKCRQTKYIVILSKEDFDVIVIYAPINNIIIKKNHCNYFKILMNNICSHPGFFYQYCPYNQAVTDLFNISVFINIQFKYMLRIYDIHTWCIQKGGGGSIPSVYSVYCSLYYKINLSNLKTTMLIEI